jgi:hypothetical protein
MSTSKEVRRWSRASSLPELRRRLAFHVIKVRDGPLPAALVASVAKSAASLARLTVSIAGMVTSLAKSTTLLAKSAASLRGWLPLQLLLA